jgi:4-hydroxy-tetrahydrodipicolinate reductase
MSDNGDIRVVQFGLGPIGLGAAEALLNRQKNGAGVQLVGAIDTAPDKVNRDLADLLGLNEPTGVLVSGDAAGLLADLKPDVVVHCTGSFFERVFDQFETCVRAGANVVSSTEEMSFPYQRHPDLSYRLDELCRAHDVTVVGTGINPGFVMDSLVVAATSPCTEIAAVRSTRIVDASKRRRPLQIKVGAGLSEAEFIRRRATGTFGHIGLVESVYLIAHALGWTVEALEETLEPVISDREVVTPHVTVAPGDVAGIDHRAVGIVAGRPAIKLMLQMYVGALAPVDRVEVDGTPPIVLEIPGGVFGDTGTVGVLVNTVDLVRDAPAGLLTVVDMPVPRFGQASGRRSVVDSVQD